MQSKTSFFNLTLLHKNVIRFSPLWIVYSAAWFVAMPLLLGMQLSGDWPPELNGVIQMLGTFLTYVGPVVACVYGVAVAMAVFSYLYSARSVSLMHSLPIRRSGLFLTNYISGLLFFVVPNLILFGITACVTLVGNVFCPGMLLAWLLGVTAMELFFYSFAVFCAMFTGNLLALPVFYGVLNVLAFVLWWSFSIFVEPFLYGFSMAGDIKLIEWLTPIAKLYDSVSVVWNYDAVDYSLSTASLVGVPVLMVYAVAGVVFAILAYAAYRCRRSESAGDIVSVGWAKVLFRYGVALTAALTIGQGLYGLVFLNSHLSGVPIRLVCMIVVGAVGFLVAQMLLQKSFRVVKKSLRGSAVCAAVILLVALGAQLDVTGFGGRVPQTAQIDSVYVTISGDGYSDATVKGEEAVEKVRALHQCIVDHRHTVRKELQDVDYSDGSGNTNMYVNLSYRLKNGTVLQRSYAMLPVHEADLEDASSLTALAQALVDDEEYRTRNALGPLASEEMDGETVTLTGGSFTYFNAGIVDVEQERVLTSSEAEAIVAALREDAAAGRTERVLVVDRRNPEERDAQDGEKRYVNNFKIDYRVGSSVNTGTAYIDLYADMTATIQALKDLGILNEYVVLRTRAEHDALCESRYQDENATVGVYEAPGAEDLLPESATESA